VVPSRTDERPWWPAVIALAALVVLARWILLAFDRTDLFVDEAQYWLWGQTLAWGYYSKPPLIAWLIEAVTTLAGSDSQFWVRMPAAALHGITAVLLAALSARVIGPRSAIWVAVAYLTLPMVGVGMMMISTDTVMAPFFVAALLMHARLCESGRARDALLVGALIGAAFLAKYAAVYFLFGAGLAALIYPQARIGWRNAALIATSFLVVTSPNLLWNVFSDLTTLQHTADNIGWVRGTANAAQMPGIAGVAEFLLSQFGMFGPVLFATLLVAMARFRTSGYLIAFALVPLLAVTAQAALDRANANWAVTAYFAGTILAMAILARIPWLRLAGLAVNAALFTCVTLLTLWPQTPIPLVAGDPPMMRYVGRAALSEELLSYSRQHGGVPIYAESRDVLADLFYTGRDSGIPFYAPRPGERARNHYEQAHALPTDIGGPLVYVSRQAPTCASLAEPAPVGRAEGAYARLGLSAYLVEGACLSLSVQS
jgi:4-amino-4-deoxy-L-arabinose transferase-like glycosyltransferase